MERIEEKVTQKQRKFDGVVIDVEHWQVQLPDGNESLREVVLHKGAAAVIPVDDKGRVAMVRQYRTPIERVTLEIPAGKLDYVGEDPFVCAQRELREETGLQLVEIREILPPAACAVGLSDEKTICVFGTAEGTFHPSAATGEEIEAAWYTREQVRALQKTELFGSWALAYSWMWANGKL